MSSGRRTGTVEFFKMYFFGEEEQELLISR